MRLSTFLKVSLFARELMFRNLIFQAVRVRCRYWRATLFLLPVNVCSWVFLWVRGRPDVSNG